MAGVLAEICRTKRDHVAACKAARSEAWLRERVADAPPTRGFQSALAARTQSGKWGLIAELKRASPAKGRIRRDFDPAPLARAYTRGGATCLSVLTDRPYFGGRDSYIATVRQATALPVLRKDFLLEPYQVLEARWLGADAVLVILAAVDDPSARDLLAAADALGMAALVEVHNRAELARAVELGADFIGINNRDLNSLQVDLDVAANLAAEVPANTTVVAESGLHSHDDLARLAADGVTNFLIGEALMGQADVAPATRALLFGPGAAQRKAA